MPDVVVTVPQKLWHAWLEEGDLPGDEPTGETWGFYTSCNGVPLIKPGERVYIVAHSKLRGYAPLTELGHWGRHVTFCRGAGAVAVTIDEPIKGFQGFRYRWWEREDEKPFPEWREP